jgi:hypothetical protein
MSRIARTIIIPAILALSAKDAYADALERREHNGTGN